MRYVFTVCLAVLMWAGAVSCSAQPPMNQSAASPTPDASSNPPPVFVESLRTSLSQETGIPVADITVKLYVAKDWGDACLGVHRPDEMCAQVITPGYQILLKTPQGDYTYHTDQSGDHVRLAQSP